MKKITIEEFYEIIKAVDTKDALPKHQLVPLQIGLQLLGRKWNGHVIYLLLGHKTMRFGEMLRRIPNITSAALSATLKRLEYDTIITRKQYEGIPVRVEYSLTDLGKKLLPVFYEIALWSLELTRLDLLNEEGVYSISSVAHD